MILLNLCDNLIDSDGIDDMHCILFIDFWY